MQPSPGRIVLYTLTEHEAAAINRQRRNYHESKSAHESTGLVGHVGNHAAAGDVYPAIIVRVWDESTVTCNLRVLLDGADTHWATSCEQDEDGHRGGSWHWPERV
ncbi:hypothetical protein [Streptomyces sp. OR43]|uniref:hypothetical protein n=1 Tax=Streptomyces sp. or43 TaxID=2478957 RepID=UPI0011CEC690|nr:hypothetical protein [Streptomyces sp. or43]TXS36918.1 hypothetical protein EAO72_26385 [Streptomyces sp. or43]